VDARIASLLNLIDEGYDRKAWHGPNLRGTIRRVDAATAARSPGPGRKCIWEHVLHAAYWKYTVRRRISGEARGSFPLKGSNWLRRPDPNVHADEWDRAWKADVALLDDVHRTLRVAVTTFPAIRLEDVSPGGTWTFAFTIRGAAMHDTYHAGQIQLIKKMIA
jgi:hypothetical protein